MGGKENFRYSVADLLALQELFMLTSEHLDKMVVYTEYKVYDERAENNRQLYRASPYFQGHEQNDWAMFDLSTEKKPEWRDFEACQIKCFVDLTDLPDDNNLSTEHGNLVPGMYALVEPASRNPDGEEQGISKLIDSWINKEDTNPKLKEAGGEHSVIQLVDLERLLAPIVVVPDLDNTNPRAYLRVLTRNLWAGVYEDYLVAPHRRDWDEPQE